MRGVARRVAHLATAGDDVGLGEGRDDTERSEPVVDVVAELGGKATRRVPACRRIARAPGRMASAYTAVLSRTRTAAPSSARCCARCSRTSVVAHVHLPPEAVVC